MGTPPSVTNPPTLTPEQIAALQQLLASKQSQSLLSPIKGWFARHHLWVHLVSIAFIGAGTAIARDPAAHQAFLAVWAIAPKWLVAGVTIATPVVGLYIQSQKSTS